MINSSRTLRGGLAVFFILGISAAAATLKVKPGTVHEGNVNGLIVLKGNEKETPSEQDPSKTVYSASYAIIKGADITSIDEKGVHQSGGLPVAILTVTQEDARLDDLDIVRRGLKIPPGPFATGYTKAGGSIVRTAGETVATSHDSVLGEFRGPTDNKEGELLPVIEIEKSTGVVKVPVADLVQVAAE